MVHPKHNFTAADTSPIKRGLNSDYVNVDGGTVSASILSQTVAFTNDRGALERKETFFVSVYDSPSSSKERIGADVEGRHGFATRRQAEVCRETMLAQVAQTRGVER